MAYGFCLFMLRSYEEQRARFPRRLEEADAKVGPYFDAFFFDKLGEVCAAAWYFPTGS